jgi:hypothetical protein
MKKSYLRILLSMGLVLAFVIGNFAPMQAASPAAEKDVQATKIILKGGFEAKVVGVDENGNTLYQTDFGAPTYCDDLKTPIDTQWHIQPDGIFKSGPNKFDSNVSAEQITIEKGNESIRWSPTLRLVGADKGNDLNLKPQNPQPEVLAKDPLNENYQRNTLVWHYAQGIDRYLRIIEGLCQEYYVINNPLTNDLTIDPHAVQTPGFIWYKKATAYDDIGTGIKLSEDSNKKITLKASSASPSDALKSLSRDEARMLQQVDIAQGKEPAVVYPITIDPDYECATSASDETAMYQGQYKASAGESWNDTHNAAAALWLEGNQSNNEACVYTFSYWVGYLTLTRRSALHFDTSALINSNIVSASLNIYLSTKQSMYGAWNAQIQNGQPYSRPTDPMVLSDYYYYYYSGNGGQLASGSMTTGAYNAISLTADGLSWINKTGTTKFVLRELEHDINNSMPPYPQPLTGNAMFYYAFEKGVGYQPKLVVTFTIPVPTNVQATDGSSPNEVTISWNASSGAIEYYVYHNTVDVSGSATLIASTSSLSTNDTSAVGGTTYYYWVQAHTSLGNSGLSNSDTGYRATHRCWGTKIKDSNTITGVSGKRCLFKDFNVPSSYSFLFAPTIIAPNQCPLEISSEYDCTAGYKRQITIFNFADSSWTAIGGNDVDPYLSGNYYYIQTIYNFGGDSKWHAELFNFNTGQWESKKDQSPDRNGELKGWDFFEEYHFSESSWPYLGKTFESDLLKVYDGSWVNCTDTYGEYFYTDLGTAPYSRGYVNNYWHWYVQD